MWSKAAEMLGHPPGVNFSPNEDELVEFFLLPRVRGEPSWFPGVVVIDDDTAANTHPTKLLERHGLAGDKDAYFFVRTADAAARQDRHCAGGGRWVSQKPVPNGPSRGKSGGGSNGWVMHEYSLTEPPCPFLKICNVTFSGHGKDAKRVPDGDAGEPAPKRARVAVAAANSGSSTCVYGSTAPAINQGYSAGAYFSIDQGMSASNQQILGSSYCLPANAMPYMGFEGIQATQLQPVQSSTWSIPFAASADGADVYLEQVPLTTEQHLPINQSATYAYGSTTTVADRQSSAAAAHAYAGREDLLADVEPTTQHQYGGDQQHGLDELEQLLWSSIEVDVDNIVF
ncbi:unnamed protein product [Urochloa decumbens]|uniref:NAC domain-containing protein n=1 Tax=Urochloa decumbens TaxID=240449 RepID=A0ABC8VDH1_9POAL